MARANCPPVYLCEPPGDTILLPDGLSDLNGHQTIGGSHGLKESCYIHTPLQLSFTTPCAVLLGSRNYTRESACELEGADAWGEMVGQLHLALSHGGW